MPQYLLMIALAVAIVFLGFYQVALMRRLWFWMFIIGMAVSFFGPTELFPAVKIGEMRTS